ncbi:MAG: DUF2283 domain-containing protein [Candidatus Omnitrophica bacterium]|nr:DUF2283 domain-containing protein [Candidatus Omnitrophota bacterium]MBI5024196.1 DUF2283 domain-containing protein [Candidatus Omnitrophota bacterium]
MNIKYFQDTDTLLVTFTENDAVETRDLSENVLLDLDKDGNIVSMTIEHAKKRASIDEFSFQQIHGH